MRRLARRLGLFLALILALLSVGTIGYSWIEGWSFADALYMTAISVSTVGYGETHPLSEMGRAFTMVLIFAGILSLTGGVSLVTSTLIELSIEGFLRKRRLERVMNRMSDHLIICGAGRIGRIVAMELAEQGVGLILIEEDRSRAEQIEQDLSGVDLLRGDATTDDVLRKAGIERARGVIAALGTDAENLYLCLAARELNPKLQIVARAEHEENVGRMEKAGADRVISPARTGAHRMVAMTLHPELSDFLDAMTRIGGMELVVESVRIDKGSPLAGRTLADAQIPQKTGMIVLSIRKPPNREFVFNPSGVTRLDANDEIVVLGDEERIERLQALVEGGAG